MKFFLIIYSAGHIGGFAGPLPYDQKECEDRRDTFRAAQAGVIASGLSADGVKIDVDTLNKMKSMKFECELRATKPVLGEPEIPAL